MSFFFRAKTGDIQKLIGQLEGVAEVKGDIVDSWEKEANLLIQQGFTIRRDPYGKKWRRRDKPRGNPLLDDTGALKGSAIATRAGFFIKMVVGTAYGALYQNGSPGGKVKQRMMIPDSSRGLPPRWRGNFQKLARTILRRHFR